MDLQCHELGATLLIKEIRRALVSAYRRIVRGYFAIEYFAQAVISYSCHIAVGGKARTRLHYYEGATYARPYDATSRRLALFVAYHAFDKLPRSNQIYLETLAMVGFRIIYIHNGPLDEQVKSSIGSICERVFCRRNMGQDFGAWKDGFLYLKETGILNDVDWLLFCNDSNHFLSGEFQNSFVKRFQNALGDDAVDLIALNKIYEWWQHYGSYFICVRHNIFTSSKFIKFWDSYLPLSHRYHSIERGEVFLTKNVLNRANARVLYRTADLFGSLCSRGVDAESFYVLLPQGALYLADDRGLRDGLNSILLQRIFSVLDCHHPAHVYALLFVMYCQAPFLKKDLLRQGVFALSQISSALRWIGLDVSDERLFNEIISSYEAQGTDVSYRKYPREAFRKGIPSRPRNFFGSGEESLVGLGLERSPVLPIVD